MLFTNGFCILYIHNTYMYTKISTFSTNTKFMLAYINILIVFRNRQQQQHSPMDKLSEWEILTHKMIEAKARNPYKGIEWIERRSNECERNMKRWSGLFGDTHANTSLIFFRLFILGCYSRWLDASVFCSFSLSTFILQLSQKNTFLLVEHHRIWVKNHRNHEKQHHRHQQNNVSVLCTCCSELVKVK